MTSSAPISAIASARVRADVVIVGAGIAGTSTLLQILRSHAGSGDGSVLRIAVVERSADLFAGLPYGERSGSASLIVTPLRDFLPDKLRKRFISWLEAHREQIAEAWPELGISAAWARHHATEILTDQWEGMFIPRRLFGRFMQESVQRQLSCSPEVEVVAVRGEVLSVREHDPALDAGLPVTQERIVDVATDDGEIELTADAVVLALGSPPKQSLRHRFGARGAGIFIEDTHSESMDGLLARVDDWMRSAPGRVSRDVLVVGANADALELLHAIHRSGLDSPWDRRFSILAPRGVPNAWQVHPDRSDEYRSVHLARLIRSTADSDLTAKGVHAMTVRDVEDAIEEGFCEQDTAADLQRLAAEALDRMPIAEQREYVRAYGNLINRFRRPTGGDYQEVASGLLAHHHLDAIAGRFDHSEAGPDGWRVHVTTPGGTAQLDGTYGVIINCTGFQDLNSTEEPLLRSLLDSGLAQSTPSARGLLVDARFQAAPGVFVAGPLLAGNLNERLRIWHIESCRRIIEMSTGVAEEVTSHLRACVASPLTVACSRDLEGSPARPDNEIYVTA